MPKFDLIDFDFMVTWEDNETTAVINHFTVDEELRRNGYGSIVVETLKRVLIEQCGAETIVLSIGGGEAAVAFAEANDFEVIKRREYDELDEGRGEFGIRARFDQEWTDELYSRPGAD